MRYNILLLLFVILPGVDYADAQILDWSDLVTLAKKNSPNLQSSEWSLRSKQAEKKASYGDFLPSVSLSKDKNSATTKALGSSSTKKTTDDGITASLNLFNGFADIAKIKKLSYEEQASVQDLILKSILVRFNLRQAYYRLLIQQKRIQLSEETLQREKNNEKFISLKYENGTEARWNLLKVRADLEKARFNLENAKNDSTTEKKNLETIVGNSISSITSNEENLYDFAESSLYSIENHPQVQKLHLQFLASEKNKTIARSAFLPSLNASYTKSRSTTEPSPRTDTGTFLLSADWNIFNGLSDFYTLQQVSAAAESLNYEWENTLKTVSNAIDTAKRAFFLAKMNLPVAKNIRTAAEERLKTISAQYRNGLKSYLDWEQAESLLVESEQAELRAQEQILLSKAELERALGYSLENL